MALETSADNCWGQFSKRVNDIIEDGFEELGLFIGRNPYPFLVSVLVFVAGLSVGIINTPNALETDLYNLWTPTNSPVFDERAFVTQNWNGFDSSQIIITAVGKDGQDLLNEAAVDEWFNHHLNWKRNIPVRTFAWKNGSAPITYFDRFLPPNQPFLPGSQTFPWGRALEICSPFSQSPAPALFYMPCFVFDIFDCFTQGGYKFPFETYLNLTLLASSFPANPFLVRPSYENLTSAELGAILGPSCLAWSGTLRTPSNFLYGGETRNGSSDSDPLLSLKTFQTTLFTDSAENLAKKLDIWTGQCTFGTAGDVICPTVTTTDRENAQKILLDYYQSYIDYMLNEISNIESDGSKQLRLVIFTPRSVGDLLAQASTADVPLLVIAYIAMIVFAALSALRWDCNWFGSKAETGVAGVLLVVLTVLATIGFGVLVVPLSPNVIQILPFIALGFGVDDMLVLLLTYRYEEKGHNDPDHVPKLIGQTLRVAGSSVALTSIANFLGFMVGAFMPLPDVSRFARYGMIVVAFNFITVILGFTAILTLTARRQHGGYADFAFLCCFQPISESATVQSDPDPDETASTILDPLYDVMGNMFVRIAVILCGLALFGVSIWGTTLARVGLPLDSILPVGEPTSNFLSVRVKYYGSYLQTLYTNAEGSNVVNIDWPSKVGTLANLSKDIRSFDPAHVYSDPSLIQSWAIGFTEFNKEEYPLAWDPRKINGQSVTSFVNPPIIPVKPLACVGPIGRFCSTVAGDFVAGSPLLLCLQSHIFKFNPVTEVACGTMVLQLVTVPVLPAATVVQVVAPFDPAVAGFYSAPFGDTSNTFVKLLPNGNFGNGHMFQRTTSTAPYSWSILDSNGVVLYTATMTGARSVPPQTNWYTTGNQPAGITLIVKNFLTDFLKVTRNNFNANASAITTHDFKFKQTIGSGQTSQGYELFQRELNGQTSWGEVHMSFLRNDTQTLVSYSCNDPTSSVPGSVCTSITAGVSMPTGEVCGNQTWWTGQCPAGTAQTPTIVTVPGSAYVDVLNFTNTTANGTLQFDPSSQLRTDACTCYTTTAPGTTNVPYAQYQPQFETGRGGSDASSINSCAPPVPTEVTVSCVPQVCTRLEACYQEIIEANIPTCNRLDTFARTSLSAPRCVAFFLTNRTLSSCCRTAMERFWSSFGCNGIRARVPATGYLPFVCPAHAYCDSTGCGDALGCNLAGGRTLTVSQLCGPELETAGCSYAQSFPSAASVNASEQCLAAVRSQFSGLGAGNSNFVQSCCNQAAIEDESTYASCRGDFATYWNGFTQTYSFSQCSGDTANMSCGAYNGSTAQFNCLQTQWATGMYSAPTNISYCCARILERSKALNVVSNDCNGDAVTLGCTTASSVNPAGVFGWGLESVVVACMRGTLLAAQAQGLPAWTLSPNCQAALGTCKLEAPTDTYAASSYTFPAGRTRNPVGFWLETAVGQNATALCPWGYTGTQTRLCSDPMSATSGGPQWQPISSVGCTLLQCSATQLSGPTGTILVPQTGAGSQVVIPMPTNASFCPTMFAQVTARCAVNTTDNTVYWATPTHMCVRPDGMWYDKASTGCDPAMSSIISITPWPTSIPAQIALLSGEQAVCFADPKCVAIELTDRLALTTNTGAQALIHYDMCKEQTLANNSGIASKLYISPIDPFRTMCLLCNPTNPLACVNRYNGEPLPNCFYNLLWWYLYNPQGLGLLDRDKFVFTDENLRGALTNSSGFLQFPPQSPSSAPVIKSTRVSFAVRGINDDAIAVEYILALRKRLDEWKAQGIPTIATGIIFDLYSQYIGVQDYIWLNCAFVAIPVAVVCLLFLWNPVAVVIVLLCDTMLIFEVIGFVEWSGLRINGVLALNVVIAIGLTMEFTAHMARAFIVADGDFADVVGMPGWDEGQVRMKKAMRAMFIPISLGAATTMIGIAPIAAARFPYFRQYYFLLYVLIVCFGWFNGVIVQPALLSFLNPKAFPKNKLAVADEEVLSTENQEVEMGGTTGAGETA